MQMANTIYDSLTSDASDCVTKTIKLGLHDMGTGCGKERLMLSKT